jgi:hypothetical protein
VGKTNQFFNPNGDKKVILSLDGGGMRGAISIAMLAELEDQAGEPCNQWFDMVAGTSTGAIIAVGLAVGLSANELLRQVYKDLLPRAFRESPVDQTILSAANILRWLGIKLAPGELDLITRIVSNDFRYAFSLKRFFELLSPLVGDKKVGELVDPNLPILFATTKDVHRGETIFITSAGKGLEAVKDWPLSGVVAASGAAPVFFPPVLKRLVDGGVGVYSNPCLAASIEAMEYIPAFKDAKVMHISLGTGYIQTRLPLETAENNNFFEWMKYVIVKGLDDAALQQVFSTRAIYGAKPAANGAGLQPGRIDFRRYNPWLKAQPITDKLGIPIPAGLDPANLSLASYDDNDIALMEQIGRKYARQIDWAKPNAMPWDTVGGHPLPGDTALGNDPIEELIWQLPYAP